MSNRKQVIVIGLGTFGMSVVKELSKYECDVMAIDERASLVDEASEYIEHVAKVNAMDRENLIQLDIKDFDVAVIGIGNDFEASVMIALLLKELGVPYIIAKSRDVTHTKFLKMLGVNKIIEPEKDIGKKIAKTIAFPNIIQSMELDSQHSVVDVLPPKNWVGKSIIDLNIRAKYNINLVCIEKEDENIKVLPTADYIIQTNDKLTLIASNEDLKNNGFLV